MNRSRIYLSGIPKELIKRAIIHSTPIQMKLFKNTLLSSRTICLSVSATDTAVLCLTERFLYFTLLRAEFVTS
jgi:hypothetical protein